MAFDLNAAIAEATNHEPFRFEFGVGIDGNGQPVDTKYELPGKFDVRALAEIQAGNLAKGFRLLLGPTQWDRICSDVAVLDETAFELLFKKYAQHTGAELGES